MARPAPLPNFEADAAREDASSRATVGEGRALTDMLPWPLLATDRNLRVVYANAAAVDLFGIGRRALVGRTLEDLWGADSVAQSLALRACNESIAVGEDALLVQRPDGNALRVAFDVAPIDPADGTRGNGLVIALRDRTIAERLDRQAAHRDGARSFGAMAGMLAHEIRNPLAGIKGAAQLLAQEPSAAAPDLTDLICGEVDRIVGVLDTVETLASGQPIATAPQNIHEILDYVCTAAAAGFARGRRFVREYDPSLPPVAADRGRLIQAFLNLVKNAAEATTTVGGEIRLSTRFDPGPIQTGPDGRRRRIPIVVSVTDDGTGIPDAIRDRLFDPFLTTKPQGRGLGLALVARIVADHGGAIDVASEPRRTRFDVMLPIADDGAAP